MNHLDFLIIGQGLAGTLLAEALIQKGYRIKIIDANHQYSSSTVAAGIINPLTGRNFVKSWDFELFLPKAIETYRRIEQSVGSQVIFKRNILRVLVNTRSKKRWLIREGDPLYQSYIASSLNPGPIINYVDGLDEIAEVTQAYQVDLSSILQHFRQRWLLAGVLISDHFDCRKISLESDKIVFQGLTADRIIFCEGQRARYNPFFSMLPIGDSKGEVLIFKSQMPGFDKMVKKKHFIVPLTKKRFWFGSKDQWGALNDLPTKEGGDYLKEAMAKILLVPYSILQHKAAIRPTVKDRRPLLGMHPVHSNVFIFNGLGTKGSLLAPYWAQKMIEFVLYQKGLAPEVNAARFY